MFAVTSAAVAAVAVSAAVLHSDGGGDRQGRVPRFSPDSVEWREEMAAYAPRDPNIAAVVDRHRGRFVDLMAQLGPLRRRSPHRLSVGVLMWVADHLGEDVNDDSAIDALLTDDGIRQVQAFAADRELLPFKPTVRRPNLAQLAMARGVEGVTRIRKHGPRRVHHAGWISDGPVDQILADVDTQRKRWRRLALHKIVNLGFGAGLLSVEMAHLREDDIVAVDGVVTVRVRAGNKPRVVPVDDQFADAVAGLKNLTGADSLFGDPAPDPSWFQTTIQHATWTGERPDLRRMSLTWLRRRVLAGADLSAIVHAAPFMTMRVYARVIDDVPDVTAEQWSTLTTPARIVDSAPDPATGGGA